MLNLYSNKKLKGENSGDGNILRYHRQDGNVA